MGYGTSSTVQSSYDAPSTLKILTKEDVEEEQRQQQDDPTQGVRWVNPPVWGDKPMCGFLFNYSAVTNKMAKHRNHVAMSKCFETEIFDKAVMINGTLTCVRYNLF